MLQVSTSEAKQKTDLIDPMEVDKPETAPDSSDINCAQPEQSEVKKQPTSNGSAPEVCNGEVSDSKIDGEDNNISSSNGSKTPVKSDTPKGKS